MRPAVVERGIPSWCEKKRRGREVQKSEETEKENKREEKKTEAEAEGTKQWALCLPFECR